ncbi:peptide chain release factor N(5)-glutamine methyltransferase [Sulfurivermis fontis]|uniref:peptide chain release factor N(5)-glutamine methyltransferase n=1 Tax=Sulfurivermis fontis TaxID=1972068 RepID=UPI000FDAB7CF|nr:peptide chain release factor N(5)-glutamine methyltransferase [Sulfurivermis fontis]
MPTVAEALAAAQLTLTGSDTPRLDAELLLCHVLDKNRAWLRTWPERALTADEQATFAELVARRAAGTPVAYLTGHCGFWSLELRVTPATLIPRPDTETLVEWALELIPADAAWSIADLGTGSGAIALAIGRERPRCRIVATDASADALAVAQENATLNQVNNVAFRHGAWFTPLAGERHHLIVSNPPYIAEHDPHLAGLRHEPRSALSAGPDGLDDIRLLIAGAPHHLPPDGWLLLEHGWDQGAAVRELLQRHGYRQVQTRRDGAGHERISGGQCPLITAAGHGCGYTWATSRDAAGWKQPG